MMINLITVLMQKMNCEKANGVTFFPFQITCKNKREGKQRAAQAILQVNVKFADII